VSFARSKTSAPKRIGSPAAVAMSRNRTVLHLFHSTVIGGIEVHILQLATAQRALGWRACVVARPDSWLAEQAASAGIDVMPLRMRGFWDVSSTARLFSIVRKQRPAVLHGHAMRGSHYARLSRRWLKGSPPLVQSAHSTHSWKHFDPAAPVICVSEAVAEALRARGFRNLPVIYNGIPEASQRSGSDKKPSMWRWLSERKRSERLLVLLQVGRFIPDKAQDWTLAQLATLPPELSSRILVLFIGDWSATEYGRACHRLRMDSPHLRARTVFLGQQDIEAVDAWYELADAVLLPSRREALGLTLLEAARSSLPVVASAVGGIPEVVQNGLTGHLFASDDTGAFGSALRRLLDPIHREELGTAARARFLSRFTAERMARETVFLYEKMLTPNRLESAP
jgi:glycosyltransferase involved in cell wall biosynthesis